MNWAADYTVTDRSYDDETRNPHSIFAPEIGCFFCIMRMYWTECLRNLCSTFRGKGNAAPVTQAAFEALKEYGGLPTRG